MHAKLPGDLQITSGRLLYTQEQHLNIPFFLILYLFLLYAYGGFACMYVSAPHACRAHRGQKEVSDPLETGLKMIVICCLSAEN